jgi:hypothetical protein
VTGSEFALILAWVLLPPCLPAIAVLLVLHRKSASRRVSRTVEAALILVAASACIALVMMFSSPPGLGSYIGIRDTPVMWAPFAFIAVALALPIAIWWAARGERP